MADGTFPAKYTFSLTAAPSCADFVVYGLNVAGVTKGQANLVGLADLYSGLNGFCKSDTATLKFAFNGSTIGGAITNSVTLSLDSTKVAYVESVTDPTTHIATKSVLHVVTIPTGTVASTIASAVAPSMKNVPSSGNWAAGDSYSSIWVDYTNDFAYVGTDDGVLHKIKNVFCATSTCNASDPSESTGWPVTLDNATGGAGKLTSPVQGPDGVIYVAGAYSGKLYAVTPAGVVTISSESFMQDSIVDGPILNVDSNGATQALYWFSNSKSSNFVKNHKNQQQPQLVQTDSTFTADFNNYPLLLNLPPNGKSPTWPSNVPVHAGTFDNVFYSSTNSTGNLWTCGWWQNDTNQDIHQGIVRFGIAGKIVTQDDSKIYAQTSPDQPMTDQNICSPLTEIVTQAMTNGVERKTDHIFVASKTGAGTSVVGTCNNSGSNASCIYSYAVISTGTPATYSLTETGSYQAASSNNDSPSGMIVDNTVDPTSSCGTGSQTCAQAASIYFSIANNSIKLTQAALQ